MNGHVTPLQVVANTPFDGAAIALLANITLEFTSSLSIEETLQQAIDRTIHYLNAEAASIFLLDESRQVLVCRRCAGPVDITGLRLQPDQGIVGAAIQTNSLQLVRNVQENPDFAAMVDEGTGFVTRSLLCVPLAIRGECIGALELINKRSGDGLFSDADLQLATAVAAAAALAIHNSRMAQRLVEQERVRRELELARAIQLSLLPAADRALPIIGLNLPARQVSGDFYDFLPLPDGRIYFCIADVAGKGMNAALLMAKATSLLRCLARRVRDPAELLGQVNAEVFETASLGLFVTIVAGFLDPVSGLLSFANAGHHPPEQRLAEGWAVTLPATAPPLGVLPELAAETQRLSLVAGPVYLFTDGVTEARDDATTPLGLGGFRRIVDAVAAARPDERLLAIVTAMEAQNRVFDDDLTLLLIDGGGSGTRQWLTER